VWQYLILQMGRNNDYRPSPIPPVDLGRDSCQHARGHQMHNAWQAFKDVGRDGDD